MPETVAELRPAGIWRLAGSLAYDGLLLLTTLYFATLILLPLNQGEAIPPNTHWYTGYLLGVTFLYLAWSWTHGGQTLAMRAWRIRLVQMDGTPMDWRKSLARFLAALLSWAVFGLGFLWILIDKDQLSWHDRLSRSRLVRTG